MVSRSHAMHLFALNEIAVPPDTIIRPIRAYPVSGIDGTVESAGG